MRGLHKESLRVAYLSQTEWGVSVQSTLRDIQRVIWGRAVKRGSREYKNTKRSSCRTHVTTRRRNRTPLHLKMINRNDDVGWNTYYCQGGFVEPCWVGLVVNVSASHTVGRGFASRVYHTKDHHKMVNLVQTASLYCTHALVEDLNSATRLSKRPGSVWNCLWGHALKRSPGMNHKSRLLYPGPGFLSSATWPSLPKKHNNGLIIIIVLLPTITTRSQMKSESVFTCVTCVPSRKAVVPSLWSMVWPGLDMNPWPTTWEADTL